MRFHNNKTNTSHDYTLRWLATKRWIANYLSGRNPPVYFNGIPSKIRAFWDGVPQGSDLFPTLFNLFLHDNPTCRRHIDSHSHKKNYKQEYNYNKLTPINLYNTPIPYTNKVKILGVTNDNGLTFKDHISNTDAHQNSELWKSLHAKNLDRARRQQGDPQPNTAAPAGHQTII